MSEPVGLFDKEDENDPVARPGKWIAPGNNNRVLEQGDCDGQPDDPQQAHAAQGDEHWRKRNAGTAHNT